MLDLALDDKSKNIFMTCKHEEMGFITRSLKTQQQNKLLFAYDTVQ